MHGLYKAAIQPAVWHRVWIFFDSVLKKRKSVLSQALQHLVHMFEVEFYV